MTDPRRDLNRADAQPFFWRAGRVACVLIHGITSTPFEVREVGTVLHKAGFTVQGIRLPGHGTNPEELHRVGWQEWTGALDHTYVELAQQHKRVYVLGSSLGAALAVWLAATRPVAGVVGLGTPLRLPWVARLAGLIARVRPFIPKKDGASRIRDPRARAIHPSYGVSSVRAVGEIRAFLSQLEPRLGAVTAPTLLLHARHDSVVPPRDAALIYERVGSLDKTLLWVHNSDHIISEDYDKEFVFASILEFLTRLEASREQPK